MILGVCVKLLSKGNHEMMSLPEAIWSSLVKDATEGFYALCASALGGLTVNLRGLLLCGLAVVVARRFHFTLIARIVDWGRSSRAER